MIEYELQVQQHGSRCIVLHHQLSQENLFMSVPTRTRQHRYHQSIYQQKAGKLITQKGIAVSLN